MDRSEKGLLIIFTVLSTGMFIGSYQYEAFAAVFPRLTSATVMVGSSLLLTQKYLPAPLAQAVGESAQLISSGSENVTNQTKEKGTESRSDESQEDEKHDRPISDSVFYSLSTALYVMFGYAVGLLWVTPMFVIVYGLWFQLPRKVIAFLSVIATAIAYLFMTVLNVSIDSGVLV